jgi:hypothetical protein
MEGANQSEAVETSLSDMRIKGESSSDEEAMGTKNLQSFPVDTPPALSVDSSHQQTSKSESQSPRNAQSSVTTPVSERHDYEAVVGGEVRWKLEPGKPPKLARTSSQKIMTRPAQLFDHLPDDTAVATSGVDVVQDCIYGSKHMGSSDHDALDCDCAESWGMCWNRSSFDPLVTTADGDS